jgi:hypothetical protein
LEVDIISDSENLQERYGIRITRKLRTRRGEQERTRTHTEGSTLRLGFSVAPIQVFWIRLRPKKSLLIPFIALFDREEEKIATK